MVLQICLKEVIIIGFSQLKFGLALYWGFTSKDQAEPFMHGHQMLKCMQDKVDMIFFLSTPAVLSVTYGSMLLVLHTIISFTATEYKVLVSTTHTKASKHSYFMSNHYKPSADKSLLE